MSSFFTLPASQRKRKREDSTATPISKKRFPATRPNDKTQNPKPAKPKQNESISSGDSEDERAASEEERVGTLSSDESDDETGAERRLRLAEQYLENIKGENEVGFDAEDIDRDLIAERLQEDAAESKGKLYRHIANSINFSAAVKTQFRANAGTTTSIAACPPYVYTVTKDLVLTKWELSTPTAPPPPTKRNRNSAWTPLSKARRPKKLIVKRGDKKKAGDPSFNHHTASILAVAASDSGKYVVTGGVDKRLILWSASDLTPLKVFSQHRDAVTSLAFRRGTNQLYSASRDRTIKTWSLDELAYVETLFGHQDEVVDVAALAKEQCLSVGARDRSVRMWIEETQLVFRGGGSGNFDRRKQQASNMGQKESLLAKKYSEGSIDRVALIDDETFVTGSDNGSLCLWSIHKKKPIFTVPLAHGLDPPLTPEEVYSEDDPDQKVPGEPQPRWITALAAVSYSDLVVSGSWDGQIRAWRVEDKRKIEALGVVGQILDQNSPSDSIGQTNASEESENASVRGIINDLKVFERGDRGQDGLCIVVATGTEHRLGRWKKIQGKNGASVFEVPKLVASKDGSLVNSQLLHSSIA